MYRTFIQVITLTLLLQFVAACNSDEEADPVPSITLSTTSLSDSLVYELYCWPPCWSDTLIVTVSDEHDAPVYGTRVQISASPANVNIFPANRDRGDTTDVNGTAQFVIRPLVGQGASAIKAECNGGTATFAWHWRPTEPLFHIYFVSPDTLWIPQGGYGMVSLGIRPGDFQTYGNTVGSFHCIPPTIIQPYTDCWWTLGSEYGTAWAFLRYYLGDILFEDSISVVVMPDTTG